MCRPQSSAAAGLQAESKRIKNFKCVDIVQQNRKRVEEELTCHLVEDRKMEVNNANIEISNDKQTHMEEGSLEVGIRAH